MGENITITEYAESRGISYEAVRQTIKRHSEEMKGHISTQNGIKYLDEEGVRLLNEWKRVSPVVIYNQEKADYFADLEKEVKELKEQLYQKQTLIESLQAKIIEMQIESTASIKLLSAHEVETEKLKVQLQSLAESNQQEKEQRAEAESKLQKAEEEKTLLNNTLERVKQEEADALKTAEQESKRADRIEKSYKKTIFGLYKKVDNLDG